MNAAHLHLVMTHLPVFGTLFGLCLLVWAHLRSSRDLERASLWVLLFSSAATVPTYLTGEPANTLLMKGWPGLSPDIGDQHAEVAMLALASASVLGILALIGLVLYRKDRRAPGFFTIAALLLSLITTGLMAWTGSLGGRIRHPEIQNTASYHGPH